MQLDSHFQSPAKCETESLPPTGVLAHGIANLIIEAPPTALARSDNDTSTRPEAPQSSGDINLLDVDGKYDPNTPATWPILYLPFHITPDCSIPTHIDEMLVHVHYKGAGATVLHQMIFEAIDCAVTEDEKQGIELAAFAYWPFNVTTDGYWKGTTGMTSEEVDLWTEMKADRKE
tara:strand:+ start:705 stop:1229 length:525 start_codon:yes stop_codon:yes gene_type:complete